MARRKNLRRRRSDNTFLFTAYTGSAAAAFGMLTTCKATFLNKKNITNDDKRMLEGVRILIIDDVSSLTASQLLKLDENLKKIGDPYKVFSGYIVLFLVGTSNKSNRWELKTIRKYGTLLHQGYLRISSTVQSSWMLCLILRTIQSMAVF